MENIKKGRQTPTASVVLPYSNTKGQEAIDLYNATTRTAQEWQELMLYDILAVNEDNLWTHTKFGYSVPRRNGKNEIVAIRELFGIVINGEKILHTAHRTTTSSSASKRLVALLDDLGYTEVIRAKKDEKYEKAYIYSKQFGLERVTILDDGGGTCDFRTRTSKGGLGEGFDLLIIDEAQEYQDDQESSLKYVVTDSKNPQTIFCGTPPTPVSSGTVFLKYRRTVLTNGANNSGWAEWSVDNMTDPNDKDAWYETNPSLGTVFTERSVADEVGTDEVDFNIQRLGLWLRYNQKSAISEKEWKALQAETMPKLKGKLHIGIKFGHGGEEQNASLSVAVFTAENKIFVETVDCRPIRSGIQWIVNFIHATAPNTATVIVDGANGQQMLCKALKDARLKQPLLPTVKEIIDANAEFESGLFSESILHMGQPSLAQAVSNCEKRAIGNNGGFGYKSIKQGVDISLLDSVILAYWSCNESKRKKQTQKITY